METAFILGVAASTSFLAFFACHGWLRWPCAGLRRAAGQAIETIGLSMMFYAVNVLFGVGLALLIRNTGSRFISLYLNADISLLVFAVLQGLFVELWWREGRRVQK